MISGCVSNSVSTFLLADRRLHRVSGMAAGREEAGFNVGVTFRKSSLRKLVMKVSRQWCWASHRSLEKTVDLLRYRKSPVVEYRS